MAKTTKLAELLLKLLISHGVTYVGLSTLSPAPGEVPSLAAFTATEPQSYLGYERKAVAMNEWHPAEGARVVASDVFWRSGDDRAWPILRTAFVATSWDANGFLLGWSGLKTSRLLLMGDVLRLSPSLNLDVEL